jgi:tetratricopeptide (TPR) repeat protein
MPADNHELEAQAQDERRLGLLILENKDGAALSAGVPHLQAAADIWGRLEWPARRAEVLLDLGRLHDKAGDARDAAGAYDEALRLFDGLGDPRAIEAAGGAGEARLRLGEAGAALAVLRRAVEIADRINDHMRIAAANHELARAHIALKQGAEALAAAEKAHRQFAAYRKGIQVARCRERFAEAQQVLGDLDAMAREYAACAAIYQDELGRSVEAGEVLLRWAEREREAGRLDQAMAVLQRARELHERGGGKAGIATVLRRFGQIHQARGEAPAAEAAYRQALDIGAAIGDQDGISRTQLLLGHLALAQGREGEGLELLRRSAETAAAGGNLHHQEQALAASAHELRARGRVEEALAAMQRWVEVLKQLGDREDALKVLGEIADLHQERGATADAEIHLRRLVQVCSRPEDRTVRARVRRQLGALLARRGEHQEAYLHLSNALAEHDPAAEPALCALLQWQLGQSSLHRHDPESALRHYEEADALLKVHADDRLRVKVLVGIGNARAQQGRDAEARAAFDAAAVLSESRGDISNTMIIRRAAKKI